MLAFLNDYTGLEKFLAFCAAVGGLLFILRLVLQFVGGDSDAGDMDVDVDADFDVDAPDVGDSADLADGDAGDVDHSGLHQGHGDTDLSFKALSFQGITAFGMMFGIVGLAMLRQSKLAPPWALLGGLAAGFGSVYVLKEIYGAASNLQSSGNIDIHNAIGQKGDVYLHIPPDGAGQVRVSVQDHLKVFDAVSQGHTEIQTGERVQVVALGANNILVVKKIDENQPTKEA